MKVVKKELVNDDEVKDASGSQSTYLSERDKLKNGSLFRSYVNTICNGFISS